MKSAIASVIVFGSAALLSPAQADTYQFVGTIAVPPSVSNTIGGQFSRFDISFFDPATQLDYVADRSNASVDIFSAATNTFVERLGGTPPTFAGQQATNDTSGPDGVQVVNMPGQHQLFVGDGPSVLWTFNINPTNPPTFSQLPTLNTGGQFRVDEMSFSPTANTLLVANNADTPAFGTLINAKTGAVIASNIVPPGTNATSGLEASDFNTKTGTFFLAIPTMAPSAANNFKPAGGVAEINAATGAVIRVIDLVAIGACTTCSPTGLAAAKNGQILIGDGTVGGSGSIIFDPTTNKVVATFPNINGVDQVWYDPTTDRWFLAAGNHTTGGPISGPILAIVDAATDSIFQLLATTPGDHSVSVDPISKEIFVPFAANAANSTCPNGCIAVFADVASAVPEPSTWAMILIGFAGLGFAFRQSRRKVSLA
jgi:hypothetical protein